MFDYRIFYPQIGVEEQRIRQPQGQRITRLGTPRRTHRQVTRR